MSIIFLRIDPGCRIQEASCVRLGLLSKYPYRATAGIRTRPNRLLICIQTKSGSLSGSIPKAILKRVRSTFCTE